MQKLTYTNILGESVVFTNAPPYVFERIRGTGSTENSITAIEGYAQDGDTLYGMRKARRRLDISFHIEGKGRADMYDKRLHLCGILAKDKAFNSDTGNRARIVYQNDGGEWWTYAVPESGLSFESRMKDFNISVPLTLRCESPFWFSMAQKQMVLAMSDAGFDLPFSFPVAFGSREFRKTLENTGQVAAPVEITILAQGETPAIINHSTGAGIRLTRPLPSGYVLYINTDPARVAVNVTSPDGETVNAFGYLDPQTALTSFALRPGLNDVEYRPDTSAGASRITIKWYELFEGV